MRTSGVKPPLFAQQWQICALRGLEVWGAVCPDVVWASGLVSFGLRGGSSPRVRATERVDGE